MVGAAQLLQWAGGFRPTEPVEKAHPRPALEVAVALEPSLANDDAYRLVYYLDGERRFGPAEETRVLIEGVGRGAQTLSVRVVDGRGEEVASSGPISLRRR